MWIVEVIALTASSLNFLESKGQFGTCSQGSCWLLHLGRMLRRDAFFESSVLREGNVEPPNLESWNCRMV